jgi:hypothetical protein
MRNLLIASFIFAFIGCAITDKSLQSALVAIGDQPGEFVGDSAATVTAWQRAEVWVTRHSETRVKVVSDNIIQNEKRKENEGSRYELTATREPIEDGMYRIVLEVGGTCYGCVPKPKELQLLFADYLRTGIDRMQGVEVRIGIK